MICVWDAELLIGGEGSLLGCASDAIGVPHKTLIHVLDSPREERWR